MVEQITLTFWNRSYSRPVLCRSGYSKNKDSSPQKLSCEFSAFLAHLMLDCCLQCFDTVGWATGRGL